MGGGLGLFWDFFFYSIILFIEMYIGLLLLSILFLAQ